MKKNLRNCIEQPVYGERVDLFNPGDPDVTQAAGLLPDIDHAKTALWRLDEHTEVRFAFNVLSLSAYRYFTFSVWAVNGVGCSFSLRLESDEIPGGKSGYVCTLPITHNGRNDYRIELPFSGIAGEPLGWDFVRAVVLKCENCGKKTVLSIGQMSLWKGLAPQLYVDRAELKRAAAFSKSGAFAIVNRKRIPLAADGNLSVKPFEEGGVLWLPMAPIAAVLGRRATVDDRAQTLHFVYHRSAYRFGAQPFYMENGVRTELRFRPHVVAGTLFFPVDFICSFFGWSQIFRDLSGLIILSNRKKILNRETEGAFISALNSELILSKPSGRQMLEDLRRRTGNNTRDRLLLTHERWMELRRACKEDAYAAGLLESLKTGYGKRSQAFSAKPVFAASALPVEEKEGLKTAADRMLSFGTLWRLTGDKKFAERAAAEGEALAQLSDWGAEKEPASAAAVALGVALCCDWWRTTWDEARKMKMERALLHLFLRPMLDTYTETAARWRAQPEIAAQVYAGWSAAAFVLSDVFPETVIRALERIVAGIPRDCLTCYAPDGGFAEGAGAWQECTGALVTVLSMFANVCGTTYGMDSMPGFAQTALFGVAVETAGGAWDPRNRNATKLNAFFLPWFGELLARLRKEELESGRKKTTAWDLLYFTKTESRASSPKTEITPDAVYRRAGLTVLRSGWGVEATGICLHGGYNEDDGIADVGAFCLDSQGVSFITDSAILVSAGGKKAQQSLKATAELTSAKGAADRAFATVDTREIAPEILRGKRGVCLLAKRTVAVIQDELTFSAPAELLWIAETPAKVVALRRRSVILESGGKQLLCRIVGATAQWKAEPATTLGMTKLTIALRANGKVKLAVACKPFADGDDPNAAFYTFTPMCSWGK